MPARTLYAAQSCTITPNAGGAKSFPVQSASCETTVPIDDISILGKLGSAGRFQKEVATCKSDVKIYLGNETGDANSVLGSFLAILTGEALAGSVSTVSVSPNGYVMSGILSHIGIDMSKGNFAMLDLSFAGVGEPDYAAVPTNVGGAGSQPASAVAVTPITTGVKIYDITASTYNNACPNSVKFSLDIPNEVISCLGGKITGAQTMVSNDNIQVAKPPFKGSLSVEGTSSEASKKVVFGEVNDVITIVLNDAKVTSKSFNQAAGNVGATYSFSVEGTDVLIS